MPTFKLEKSSNPKRWGDNMKRPNPQKIHDTCETLAQMGKGTKGLSQTSRGKILGHIPPRQPRCKARSLLA